jgi:hypothetical protein
MRHRPPRVRTAPPAPRVLTTLASHASAAPTTHARALFRHAAPIATIGFFALTLAGCAFFRRLGGADTVNLEKADVRSMSVDLRREQKTICPRSPVQMAVYAEVLFDGDKAAKQFETWAGRDGYDRIDKNDKLEFSEFAFHSTHGRFDRDGWFVPNADLLATAGREFEIQTVYRRRPDQFTFTTSYKPDYGCIDGAGKSGSAGDSGQSGAAGEPGRDGALGSTTAAGGPGGDGASGSPGGAGSDGAPGPTLRAYATMVKTPFYDRLIAIRIEGDASDFLLVPEGKHVTLHASGGRGGDGGQGGHGGRGGAGGGGNPAGAGGRGGTGGVGGSGGSGGAGGAIELVYDTRFPELATLIALDVRGGRGGAGGTGGQGGERGRGGNGMTPPSSGGQSHPTTPSGPEGSAGQSGSSGTPGHPGRDGRATKHAADVREKFAGADGVSVL